MYVILTRKELDMHNICVITGTRAEYHILFPLLKRIQESDQYDLKLAVTGSHLSDKYGNTYKDIENDGVEIAVKIPILSDDDSITEINYAMSKAIIGFDKFFSETKIDLVFVLGDRYELLSAAIAAMNHRIPIAHINGGDTTEGAIDECIRHSITKMSSIHFPTCEPYRRRVIQLGENPNRVFNVGSLGVENTLSIKRMNKEALSNSLRFDLSGRFAVVTFHPVTLEQDTAGEEFRQLLDSLVDFPDLKIVFTKSNADTGGLLINGMIDDFAEKHSDRSVSVFSLGLVRYLSALSMADVIIGNSSSGIYETPTFSVPTINIGDRQKGRIQAKNIINCIPKHSEISAAIEKALSKEFRDEVRDTVNPYGDGNTSQRIMEKLDYFFEHPDIFQLKKSFYDLDFNYAKPGKESL